MKANIHYERMNEEQKRQLIDMALSGIISFDNTPQQEPKQEDIQMPLYAKPMYEKRRGLDRIHWKEVVQKSRAYLKQHGKASHDELLKHALPHRESFSGQERSHLNKLLKANTYGIRYNRTKKIWMTLAHHKATRKPYEPTKQQQENLNRIMQRARELRAKFPHVKWNECVKYASEQIQEEKRIKQKESDNYILDLKGSKWEPF